MEMVTWTKCEPSNLELETKADFIVEIWIGIEI